MKIEFIEEEVIDETGTRYRYFTEVNGAYANDSLKHDREKALSIYHKIVENNGVFPIVTRNVLETKETPA